MTGFTRNATDKQRAWLSAGPVDRGVGDGLTFVATTAAARAGKGSWILRYRFGGRHREKVIGRYPDISPRRQGTCTQGKYKHPEALARVLRLHINPVIGRLPIDEVRPVHIDRVLTKIVRAGAPTGANDALRYMFRMFHFAVKRRWIESNPVYGFEISDAGGTESSRVRWLNREELAVLSRAMRETPNFGRLNELAVWLLLALCVRKMELLSARWSEFDLQEGIWSLRRNATPAGRRPTDQFTAPSSWPARLAATPGTRASRCSDRASGWRAGCR